MSHKLLNISSKFYRLLLNNRILIFLLLITYQIQFRAHIFNNVICFIIPIFLMSIDCCKLFISNFRKNNFVSNKIQIISISLILLIIITALIRSQDTNYIKNLIVILIYPLMFINSSIYINYLDIKFLKNQILKWILFSYIIDSLYIYLEIFFHFSGFVEGLQILKGPFAETLFPERFQNAFFSIYDYGVLKFQYFPIFLGPRGFPEYSILLFTIFSIILITKKYSIRKSFEFYFITINSLIILSLSGVIASFLCFLMFLLILMRPKKLRYLRKSDLNFSLIIISISIFIYVSVPEINQFVNTKFILIFQGINDKSRLEMIFNFENSFQIIKRMDTIQFLFGSLDISKLNLRDIDLENEIINVFYCYGLIFMIALITLNFQTFILFNRAKKISELNLLQVGDYLFLPPIFLLAVFVDVLHFGQSFNLPDIALISFLTGMCSNSTNYILKSLSKNK